MQRESQSIIVETTLRELLLRNVSADKRGQSVVLVLLFHHMMGRTRELPELKELHRRHYRVRICPDEELLKIHDVKELTKWTGIDDWLTWQEAERKKEKFDYVYIPVLPFSTVMGVIQLHDAHPLIRILLWALMSGKKVIADASGANPYHPIWQVSGLQHGSNPLKREMKNRLQQMRAFGIHLIDHPDEVLSYFHRMKEQEEKHVITAETIKQAISTGKRIIQVGKGTIITPLARDMIREYNLEVREEGGG